MKKIKIIVLALATVMLGVSCEDDGGTANIELEDGAVPNMSKTADGDLIIDLIKVTAGEPVNLEYTAEVAQGSPTSADIIGSYKPLGADDAYSAVLFTDVTLPQDFTMTVPDIVNAFTELNSSADVKLGDVLSITTRFTMPDGRVLNILNDNGTFNVSSNIQTTVLFTTVITYPVSCPTMLEGSYTSTVIATNQAAGTFISPQAVTITQPSAGTYVLNDGTAGLFGAGTPIGLQFTDVCGTITVSSPSVSFPGQVDFVQNSASLDPATGIITLELDFTPTSCCGLPGTTYTLELVPN